MGDNEGAEIRNTATSVLKRYIRLGPVLVKSSVSFPKIPIALDHQV